MHNLMTKLRQSREWPGMSLYQEGGNLNDPAFKFHRLPKWVSAMLVSLEYMISYDLIKTATSCSNEH